MKDTSVVLQTALPLYLEGTNGKAVLIQHGYNGYPGDMYELARAVNAAGYTVVLPRLPGHGTNGRDFRNTDWKLWRSHHRNEYLNLQSRYDSITLVGLSMGGVLALMAAADFKPEKVILLAPAMAVSIKILHLTPILKFFLPVVKRKRGVTETDPDRQILANEYWSYHFSATIASLMKLIRMARRQLKEVVCPVYIMLSEKDTSVPLESGKIISDGVSGPVKQRVLKNSPHVFFEGEEKDTAIEQVLQWLEEGK